MDELAATDEVLRDSISDRVLGFPRQPDEVDRRETPWHRLWRS